MRIAAIIILLTCPTQLHGAESPVQVGDDLSLRAAISSARPGTRILIAPGRYRPGVDIRLTGTSKEPIVIEGADADDPPLFEGGAEALHLSDCAHITLRNITCRAQSGNGINVDDGGTFATPSHHIILERLRISETGPQGNHDAIKLSGVKNFLVRDCEIEGWGGQAIDMVGCHEGLIERCTFRGRAGFSQHSGPQTKGGTSRVVVRDCTFVEAGRRAMQIGGSTGLAYFRPPGVLYEARDITVEGCRFVGSEAPVTFVGVDGAVVRYNTFYLPTKWAMRILQETTAEGFIACRNGRFERNLVVFRSAALRPPVNVGPHTASETFTFRENFWFCEDRPSASRPDLPAPEQGGLYGLAPRLKSPARLDLTPTDRRAALYGATALPQLTTRAGK